MNVSKRQHRFLMTLSLSVTGIGGLLAATDPSGLGVPVHTWAYVCLGASMFGIVINAARSAWGDQ